MLHALKDISMAVTKGMKAIEKAVHHFMNCTYCNPDAAIIYQASDMFIQADSDATYLVASNAHSRLSATILSTTNMTPFSTETPMSWQKLSRTLWHL